MLKKHHTRQTITDTLKNLAKQKNKDSLGQRDLSGVLPLSAVRYYFGSFGNALEAAGLRRHKAWEHFQGQGPKINQDDLFRSIQHLERTLGRLPTSSEYNAMGDYSVKPLRDRFGKWRDALREYQIWKNGQNARSVEKEKATPGQTQHTPVAVSIPSPQLTQGALKSSGPPQLFGEPIDFRGLRNAPINEQGVIYVFGMVSRELGFSVEALQQGFPDCEGKYLYDQKKNLWAKARIEFKASNFQEHGHPIDQCDFIVCWENNWPDCPINVIALKSEILRLPSK